MPLASGSRIGPYEIVASLGAGGMGEVYRAKDPALGREVAIKVLPDAVAEDADRLARFEREAKALAALNHPNIAQVYGFEQGADVASGFSRTTADGQRFIVNTAVPSKVPPHVVVIVNWPALLKQDGLRKP